MEFDDNPLAGHLSIRKTHAKIYYSCYFSKMREAVYFTGVYLLFYILRLFYGYEYTLIPLLNLTFNKFNDQIKKRKKNKQKKTVVYDA